MATKYLDKIGLAYFWSKIKAWCSSIFVSKTGDQSIEGQVTLDSTRDAYFANSHVSGLYIRNSEVDRGIFPETGTKYTQIVLGDKEGELEDQNQSTYGRLGLFEHVITSDNKSYLKLSCYNYTNEWTTTAEKIASANLYLGYDADGNQLCETVSTSENRTNGGDVLTRDWIPKDTRIVHTANDETISGLKTFTNTITIKNEGITRGTAPSTNRERILYFYDSAGNKTGALSSIYLTDKSSRNAIYAYNTTVATGNNNIGYLGIGCDKDGNVFTCAPTPASSSNDTNIATTAFVKAQGYLTSHQSLDGKMTRGSYERIQGTSDTHKDLNNYKTAGFYNVKTAYVDNCPSGIGVDAVLLVYPWDSGSYCTQELTESAASGNVRRWIRKLNSSTWSTWKQVAYTDSDITGNAANVTGIVAIANGGTGATTRLNAIKALTNENVGTNATHFLGLKSDWSKVGYFTLAEAKTLLGLGSAAYTASTDYATSDHTHSYLPLSGGTLTGNINIKNSSVTKGTAPSSNAERIVRFYDSADHKMGALSTVYYTDKSSKVAIYAYNTSVASNETNIGYIAVGSNADGSVYTYAPNPASSSNDNSIATTKWASDNCVKVSGDQTVAGTKTFSSTVLSAGIAGKGGDSGDCYLSGQPDSGKGAWIGVYGKTRSAIPGYVRIQARTESNGKTLECKPNGDLTWNGNAIQISSDERIKTRLESVSDDVLDDWDNVKWGQFKLLESVETKKEKARYHVGLIAQQVNQAFSKSETSILDYGILCYEQDDLFDLWTVRYTEALCMEAAYQRRKNKILENRISELENQLSSVLQTLKELKGVG